MKKYLLIVAFLVALPLASYAVYDDVTILSSDTAVISLNSVSLTVSSGKSAVVESITVNSGDFSVVMPASSYLRVVLSSKRVLTITNEGTVTVTSTCSDSESAYKLENPSTGTEQTDTVTLASGTCSMGGGGGSSGGGGGGGGGGPAYTPVVTATPAVPATLPVPVVSSAIPATRAVPAVVFRKPLSVGITSSDVQALQQILNSDTDTKIASVGAGSPGNETKYFGPATKKAIE